MIELLAEKLIKNGRIINLDLGEVSSEAPAIILSLKESEEIYNIKRSTIGFEKEKEGVILEIKLEDRISSDKIFEEDNNAESRHNSGN